MSTTIAPHSEGSPLNEYLLIPARPTSPHGLFLLVLMGAEIIKIMELNKVGSMSRLFCLIYISLLASPHSLGADTLTLYTSRNTDLIEPVIQAYEKTFPVKIKHINGSAGTLIQKLTREGKNTPADILITVDAGHLVHAAELGLLQKVASKTLLQSVPSTLRDPDNRWFAVSLRARAIFYNMDKVDPKELKSYEDLADSKWKGRLCLRTSHKVYNQSLVASLLGRMSEKDLTRTLSGWVKNLARPVFTSDTHLLEAISNSQCDVGIANTYYLARLQRNGQAKNVKVFWPNQKNGGVHVNISGVGLVKESKNKELGQKFMEWLVSDKAQKIFANANDEYPVVKSVSSVPILQAWGTFVADPTPLTEIAKNQKRAIHLIDKARYR